MKLLAFDIDDTLIGPDKVFQKSTIASLNERLKQGDVIAIASGRPYIGIMRFLNQLRDGEKYPIGANGAVVYDEKGNVLMAQGLRYQDFLDFYAEHKDIIPFGGGLYCYTLHEVAYFERSTFIDFEVHWNGMPERDLMKSPLRPEDPILKIMVTFAPEKWARFQASENDIARYHIIRSDPRFLEFMAPGADKATGVEFLRKRFALPKENVYCFGDQENDLKMIADYQGVAMGNAIDACKKAAHFVTTSAAEDGVSFALKNFVK
jgi:Cof subfamily protein (haloacid dehalogenase superfamily)